MRSEPKPSELSEIFLSITELNALSIDDMAVLTGENKKTIELWLHDKKSFPTWRALFLIHEAMRMAGGNIPRELSRYISRDIARVRRWAGSNKISDSPNYIGEKTQSHGHQFIYHGQLMTIPQISELCGRRHAATNQRIRRSGVAPGGDVTGAIDANSSRGRPKSPPSISLTALETTTNDQQA